MLRRGEGRGHRRRRRQRRAEEPHEQPNRHDGGGQHLRHAARPQRGGDRLARREEDGGEG